MPVAGSIKLDLIADSQDRATATLRAVQGELKKTEDRIRSASAAGKEDGDISDILARGSEKSRSALRSEVDAREAAAATRRKAVQAAREAAGATAEEVGALGKLKSGVEGTSRGMEFLNKVVGIAGFAGAAVAAVGGIIELVGGLNSYQDVLEPIKATQERFNELLADFEKRGRDLDLNLLGDDERKIAEAGDDLEKLKTLYLEFHQEASARDSVALNLSTRIAKAQEDMARDRERGMLTASSEQIISANILEIQRELNPLVADLARTRAAEEKALRLIADAQERANWPLQTAKNMARDLSSSLESASKFADGVGSALAKSLGNISWNPLKALGLDQSSEEAGKEIEKKEKERLAKLEAARNRGAAAGESAKKKAEREAKELADKETGIRREVELLEFEAQYEDEHQRKMAGLALESYRLEADLSAKRIARSTYELMRRKLDLQAQLELSAEVVRVGEAEAKAEEKKKDSIEKAAKAAKDAKSKSDKDAADALERRAKGIEKIGDYARDADAPLQALSGRLGGLAQSVDETAGIWANYERGQESLGDAVSGTLGSIGSAVAGAISDKKAQAAVEGGFESAASIASFASGNIPAGIGHAAAAAAFFGVAAGGGASASSGAGGGGAGRSTGSNVIQGNFGQRQVSSQQADTRVSVVHHYGEGIVYGLGADVAKTASGTADSLRWTGMHRRRF